MQCSNASGSNTLASNLPAGMQAGYYRRFQLVFHLFI
jgi:hypothetical protein